MLIGMRAKVASLEAAKRLVVAVEVMAMTRPHRNTCTFTWGKVHRQPERVECLIVEPED